MKKTVVEKIVIGKDQARGGNFSLGKAKDLILPPKVCGAEVTDGFFPKTFRGNGEGKARRQDNVAVFGFEIGPGFHIVGTVLQKVEKMDGGERD